MERYLPTGWVLPEVTDVSAPFHTAGRLMLQSCTRCGHVQHPPAEMCLDCGSFELGALEAEARGTVSSYTIVHHPAHPMLNDAVPYNVVVVQLDAYPHVHIVGNVVNAVDNVVRIGDRVEGDFTDVLDDGDGMPVKLLQWRLA